MHAHLQMIIDLRSRKIEFDPKTKNFTVRLKIKRIELRQNKHIYYINANPDIDEYAVYIKCLLWRLPDKLTFIFNAHNNSIGCGDLDKCCIWKRISYNHELIFKLVDKLLADVKMNRWCDV